VKLPTHVFEIIQSAFQPLSLDAEKHYGFFSFWEAVEFSRHQFITEAGKTEKAFYVVESGVQAIYILDLKGNKNVIGFSFDGSFSGIYDSFLYKKPSAYFLEALTPSKLWKISKANYDQLFELYPEFDRWGRIIHADLLVGRVQREIELTTLTAKERFQLFIDRCPDELRTIPQKYLASYLNMTAETFSRLRKEYVIS
jgi:CRP-like cAMP-binding protein